MLLTARSLRPRIPRRLVLSRPPTWTRFEPTSTMTLRTTLELTTGYILKQYERHLASDKHDQALVVAIQGPQGSGKSYLASLLEHSPKLEHLKIANLSLDDLYLPHDQLVRLAESNPNNSLLSGRGQAGTHDLELGINVLRALKESNNNTRVDLPRFDKSLFQGQGDRVPKEQFRTIKGKVDLVLFEGWMNGFQPVSPSSELDAILNLEHSDQRRQAFGIRPQEELFLEQYSHEVLERLNRDLEPYCELWNLVDAWVELKPQQLGYVWEWRLEV